MAFVLTLYGVLGMAAGALAWATGWVIYQASPTRTHNRLLAALLFLEGSVIGATTGLIFLTDDPASVIGWQMVGLVGGPLVYYVLYPRILRELPSPLAAPFRSRVVLGALALVAAAVMTSGLLQLEKWAPGVHAVNFAPYDALFGPYAFLQFGFTSLVSLYALAISVSAVRRAPRGSALRARARAFAMAFGARDVVLIASFAALTAAGNASRSPLLDAGVFLFTINPLIYIPILGYGILKTQLFDIDLKLKFTVRQSTIAAAFVAVFFIVSESAATFFGTRTTSAYLGIAAAGLLVFAMAPLQRLADRVASTAVPGASGSPEYVAARKFEVYRAAVESALEGGGDVTPRERAILDRLRAKLGIAETDARLIESEMRA